MLKFIAAVLVLAAASVAQAQVNPAQGTWTTTLQARDLNADGTTDAYYDTDLNVTWLADANYAATTGVPPSAITPGYMTFSEATAWVGGLAFGSIDDWRLPAATFTENAQCPMFDIVAIVGCDYTPNPANNEMAHLFSVTLGNASGSPTGPVVSTLTNVGPFLNLESGSVNDLYWTGSRYRGPTQTMTSVMYFNFTNGAGIADPQQLRAYAMAVHDGDVGASPVPVSPVPAPPTAMLMLAGLSALGWLVKRRSH